MGSIAEKIFETVKQLPEQQAAEVLDFAEFLQTRMLQEQTGRKEKALAMLDHYAGLYDGAPFNREELHERT